MERRKEEEFDLDYSSINQRRGRFASDDYSRYAGPDFSEGRQGVSGKDRDKGRWINRADLARQRNFAGKGPKGYRRSDDRIYEEVCEVLMKSPDVDAGQVGVTVKDGSVLLEGTVPARQSKKLAEYLIEDLPGVIEVRNHLTVGGANDHQNLSR